MLLRKLGLISLKFDLVFDSYWSVGKLFSVPYGEVASAYSAVFDVARSKLPQTNGSKSPKKPEKKPEKKPDKKEAPKEDPKPKTLEEAAKKVIIVFLHWLNHVSGSQLVCPEKF